MSQSTAPVQRLLPMPCAPSPEELAASYDRAGRAFIRAAGHCRATADLIQRNRWRHSEEMIGVIMQSLESGLKELGLMD